MKKSLALLGLLVILTSCATVGQRLSQISPGMTKPQVIQILGKPHSTGGVSGVEVIHYIQDDGGWRNSYFFVRFVEGKVESYGSETRANPVTDSHPPIKK